MVVILEDGTGQKERQSEVQMSEKSRYPGIIE